ncbi:hypothetical protein BC940DRAFT_338176 [Gongronella butleri]|nr:hypothetical protein BC940DRAFT_338176 [Gongronella butleri]
MLSVFFVCLFFVSWVLGNTEKAMFAAKASNRDCLSLDEVLVEPSHVLSPQSDIVTVWPANQSFLYPFAHVERERRYEVRVSYPATTPTDIQIDLVCKRDTDVIYGVLFVPTYAGVSNQPDKDYPSVPVHIVLEPLLFGVVHEGILRVLAVIGGALIFGTFVAYPRLQALLLTPSIKQG